jgi:GMP synthase (glutamine-hydrolysing)
MRLHVLQHVPFEGPAAIADWAAERGVPMAVTHVYRGEPLPNFASFDMLAVMGGPMSVNDGERFSWLDPEIELVAEAIHTGKTVLGVCLGAQMIAKALGAKVYPGTQKEIGWYPVQKTRDASAIFDGIPDVFTAFHWHGETFDLPAGATLLASTQATPRQAFAYGESVLGLQFHIEATSSSVGALLENAVADIGDGPFEQSPEAILAGIEQCAELRLLLDRVLHNLTGSTHKSK